MQNIIDRIVAFFKSISIDSGQFVVYSFAMILIIAAALIIYKVGQMRGEAKVSRMIKNSMSQLWEHQKKQIHGMYQDESQRKMFQRAGSPKWMTEVSFKLIRDSFFIIQLIFLHGKWLIVGGGYPIQTVSGILLLYMVLSIRKGFPIEKLLEYFERLRNSGKNKELYILYSLFLNEYAISGNKPTNVYSLLRKFRPHFKLLQPAIDLCTMHWRKSPSYALEAFSREVGTNQASELAAILEDVDKISPKDAYSVMTNRYDHFNAVRLEDFRRRAKDRGTIGYFVVFVPALSILFNFGYVYYLEYQDLISVLNNQTF